MTFVGVFVVVAARDRRVGAARDDDPDPDGGVESRESRSGRVTGRAGRRESELNEGKEC